MAYKMNGPSLYKGDKLKDLRANDKNIDLDKGGNEPVKSSGFGPRVSGSGNNELNTNVEPEDTAE
tara:strand:- start:297 stop:491 length:195 start_codon:yes stop_codon:yes gene_type:complete